MKEHRKWAKRSGIAIWHAANVQDYRASEALRSETAGIGEDPEPFPVYAEALCAVERLLVDDPRVERSVPGSMAAHLLHHLRPSGASSPWPF